MLQAINSKRKSEGNDCTENISDQTFKRLFAIYFIPYDRKYAYCKVLIIHPVEVKHDRMQDTPPR